MFLNRKDVRRICCDLESKARKRLRSVDNLKSPLKEASREVAKAYLSMADQLRKAIGDLPRSAVVKASV